MLSKYSKPAAPHRGFVFDMFVLDIDRAALLHNGKNVGLRPKSLDVLRFLVEHAGCLVEKEELMDAVWQKAAVSDDSLTHCLIDIRKVLGDTERKMIRTVPRRGFIFDLPVEPISVAVRQERHRRRSRLFYAIAAGALLCVGVGYLLLSAYQPGNQSPAGPAAQESQLSQEAVDLHVRGRFLFNRRAVGDLETAQQLLQQAVDLEPEFAAAWAELAGVYVLEYFSNSDAGSEVLPLLKDAAERAVKLDPNLAAGWVRLAQYYAATGDRPSADRHMQRAIDLESQDPLLLAVLAGKFAAVGDLDRAVKVQQQALVADPLSLVNRFNLSGYLLAAGRYDDALRVAEQAAQLGPETAGSEINIAFSLIKLEQFERALELAAGWPDGPDKDVVLAMAGLVLNRDAIAMEAIARLESSTDVESLRHLAELEAFCENIENSFAILAQLRDQVRGQGDRRKLRWQLLMIRLSPFLAPVRADPRWHEWLEEANTPLIARSQRQPVNNSVK
jgi:DNA-binding winged helix-turn-helix (wHTH) protein/Tfp pilus assembly protein PilF